MDHKESEDASTAAIGRGKESEKSRFTIMPVVLVNAFLFSSCFFMGNSVFPVSILGNVYRHNKLCFFIYPRKKGRFLIFYISH